MNEIQHFTDTDFIKYLWIFHPFQLRFTPFFSNNGHFLTLFVAKDASNWKQCGKIGPIVILFLLVMVISGKHVNDMF